jgi:hypothetical protein
MCFGEVIGFLKASTPVHTMLAAKRSIRRGTFDYNCKHAEAFKITIKKSKTCDFEKEIMSISELNKQQ